MNWKRDDGAVEQELRALEHRIEDLARICDQLKRENRLLRNQQDTWAVERAGFVERQERARSRVEAMIGRLKSLEQAT
jgi:cell division protein ZapB